VRRGIVQVLEGRRCFPHLTVEQNVLAGGLVHRPSRRALAADLERVYAWFPRLRQKRRTPAGLTSGGEQQMVAIGRALMTRPTLMLLDEPSMGLAPRIVDEVFEAIGKIRAMGVTVLLVEQNVELALEVCDTVAVLDHGRLVFHGTGAELARDTKLTQVYLGVA
jgi:branched-chain amino acid transport system ATP-binding protein